MQFMPSTYDAWAVDGDGDGKRNLYASLPDAFHSAGGLPQGGRLAGGRAVGARRCVSARASLATAMSRCARPLRRSTPGASGAGLGVARADGSPLPADDLPAAPPPPRRGPRGPLSWSIATTSGSSTGTARSSTPSRWGSLADQVTGAPPLARPPPPEERVRISEIRALQEGLAKLGLYEREIDGVFGSGTRAAIAAFQRRQGLPADGHLNRALLERVAPRSRALEAGAGPRAEPGPRGARSPLEAGGRALGALGSA